MDRGTRAGGTTRRSRLRAATAFVRLPEPGHLEEDHPVLLSQQIVPATEPQAACAVQTDQHGAIAGLQVADLETVRLHKPLNEGRTRGRHGGMLRLSHGTPTHGCWQPAGGRGTRRPYGER